MKNGLDEETWEVLDGNMVGSLEIASDREMEDVNREKSWRVLGEDEAKERTEGAVPDEQVFEEDCRKEGRDVSRGSEIYLEGNSNSHKPSFPPSSVVSLSNLSFPSRSNRSAAPPSKLNGVEARYPVGSGSSHA